MTYAKAVYDIGTETQFAHFVGDLCCWPFLHSLSLSRSLSLSISLPPLSLSLYLFVAFGAARAPSAARATVQGMGIMTLIPIIDFRFRAIKNTIEICRQSCSTST